jgi:hypothetical protein
MNNPWAVIERPSTDFNVRLAREHHPLRLYWGMDSHGRYLFILDVSESAVPAKGKIADLEGVRIGTAIQNGRARIFLLLNETANWELFKALCDDIARAGEAMLDEITAVEAAVQRLHRWQDFLRRARRDLLTPEEVKGLVGELLFLEGPIADRFGWDAAIDFWKGPEDAPQDFAIHRLAVEVKCQSGASRPSVRITSLEQLSPQLPVGYLVVQTLATAEQDDAGAFSLNTLIDRIRTRLLSASLAAQERFDGLLFAAGYLPHDSYDGPLFQHVSSDSYRIREGFPRLLPDGIPSGINKVTYQLELEACGPFAEQIDFNLS